MRVEYIDHATIKGDVSLCGSPPVLISMGEIEKMSDKALIIKSMFSGTTGETKIHQLVVRSCIIKLDRLKKMDDPQAKFEIQPDGIRMVKDK